MAPLSGGTRNNFEIAARKCARRLVAELRSERWDDQEAAYRLFDTLLRAARRGAKHPEWFSDEPDDDDNRGNR